MPTNTISSVAAIPWRQSSVTLGGSVWVWDTPHFTVTVTGNERSCYYRIDDKSANPSGEPETLDDGIRSSFNEAEDAVRETIGKSYPSSLGYSQYTGPYATTFTLFTGETVDFGPLSGRLLTVAVVQEDSTTVDYTGKVYPFHYSIVVEADGTTYKISPNHISEIRTPTGKPVSIAKPLDNRTVVGTVGRGCTGHPGFEAGTVEHTGRSCPIHEP